MEPPKSSKLDGGGGGDGGSGGNRDYGEAKVVKVVISKCKKADHERFTVRFSIFSHISDTVSICLRTTRSEKSPRQERFELLAFHFCIIESKRSISSDLTATQFAGLQESNTEKNRPCRTIKDEDPEFAYIKSILEHAKIAGGRTWRWYLRSVPIDPVIFHRLELEFPFILISEGYRRKGSGEEDCASRLLLGHLRHQWNRKLLFHLVQEILGDLLVESSNLSSSAAASSLIRGKNRIAVDGKALLWEPVARIESFPAADCRVVGDIDALVTGDVVEANVRRLSLHTSVVEEAGDVVSEVEREILDGLLSDTAVSLALSPPPSAAAAVGPSASVGGTVRCSRKRRERG